MPKFSGKSLDIKQANILGSSGELAKLNNIAAPYTIHYGQVLTITGPPYYNAPKGWVSAGL